MSLISKLFSGRRGFGKTTCMAASAVTRSRRRRRGAKVPSPTRRGHGSPLYVGESLESRIALSVSTYVRERFDEVFFSAGSAGVVATQPGTAFITSDLGSDVYVQQLQTTPSELLVADNGSFLDYVAIEDVDNRFDEILVTNGTAQRLAIAGTIPADSWWLFPSSQNPANLNTTKLALDRPFLEIGPTRDFFGSVSLQQGDGTISTWTYSAWDGTTNTIPAYKNVGDPFEITSGPGFGGRPESFRRQTVTPIQELPTGYVFPRSIRVEAETQGATRNYLVVEWSQTPAAPPVIEANYYGYSHIAGGLFGGGFRQNVRDPFAPDAALPTIGIAMRTSRLDVTLPAAIAGGSADGAASLGIIPGTLGGTLVIGPDGQDQYVREFQDRRNVADATSTADQDVTGYSLFFDNPDENIRQFGLLKDELTPGVISDLDSRFIEERGTPSTYIEGRVVDQSQIQFVIGSTMSSDPGYSGIGGNRALDGINVPLRISNLEDGTALSAVRVRDLAYAVFVKPTIANDVVFAPGATVTRSVTVDLLSEGSSVFINSPIAVTDGDLDFRATNIEINAPTSTPDYFFVGRSESQQFARLPRSASPQGGLQTTPTFGAVLPQSAKSRPVVVTPILSDGEIVTLAVLPGNEGYGYDPLNPPRVTLGASAVQEADVSVLKVAGGVGELTLLAPGSGYPDRAEEIEVTFSAPELRRVDELRRWTTSPLPEGYALNAPPVLAISQPEVVASQVRVGYGERARAEVVVGNGLRAVLANGGSNYSEAPRIDIVLSDTAKAQGVDFFDPASDPRFRRRPEFDLEMDINIASVTKDGVTTKTFNGGRISSVTVSNPGFGLNFTTLEEFAARYEFVISDGVFDAAQQAQVAKTTFVNYPTAANHGAVTLSPVLGSLAWSDNWESGSGVELLDRGLHYELSPDIQFVGKLSADVRVSSANPVADDSATHLVSLFDVLAYADDTEESQFARGTFRDVDYLSYVNDPLYAENIIARVSVDGVNFFTVDVGTFTGVDGSSNNLDEYTGQLGVRPRFGIVYPGGFEGFINAADVVDVYFHEEFVDLELVAAGEAYAVMGKDPARGRAVASGGEVTNIEVTYPGSGYRRVPSVTISGGGGAGAAAAAIVVGGVYEVDINSPGFNYVSVPVPGAGRGALLGQEIDVFGAAVSQLGNRNPTVDFEVRNTALQGGNVLDPGAGLQITGNPGSTELTGFESTNLLIPGNDDGDGAGEGEPAEFKAVIEADGRILGFEKITGGKGFSLAPLVTVDPPPVPADATARATIDASRGIVTAIVPIDAGLRYSVPPRVVVLPPNPRGEGVAAQAEAILDLSGAIQRIVVTDGGSGYTAPPEVLVQPRFNFAASESLDVSSTISARHFELYVSDSQWTEQPRGRVLVRPEASLSQIVPVVDETGNVINTRRGNSQTLYVEASAADLIFEGDVQAAELMFLVNSRSDQQILAPYTVTTRSLATGEQSGTIRGDTLSITLGNDVPTPEVGSALSNSLQIRTEVANLRVTAAESAGDPRGAFPYELAVEEVDDLIVDAVPRTGGKLAFTVADELKISSAVRTDGDVAIVAGTFSQSAPVVTTVGAIAVEATAVAIRNSLQVLAAPLDQDRVDITLTSTAGDIELVGLIESPNAIEIRQRGDLGKVFGASRVATDRLRIDADGSVDVTTAVRSVTGSSETGGFRISELDDVYFERVTAPAGTVSLAAGGVDRGSNGDNPIALKARVLEAQAVEFSTPNGSMEIVLDTSRQISVGDRAALSAIETAATPMRAAGSVTITSTAGGIDLLDGPVAGGAARVVRVATTGPLDARFTYQGNTPGAFPSTLTGSGALPPIDGIRLAVGDRVLIKNQADAAVTARIDESRANGIYVVSRLGGGVAGFRDWQLVRATDADTRDELLPGTFVRVTEGATQASSVFQFGYADVPELRVSRTLNNQLVVAGSIGGLLNLKVNDLVSGDGIVPGARVTGVDYANGVISLGVGNEIEVVVSGGGNSLVVADSISPYVFDAVTAARGRGESVLVSGDGIRVGTTIVSVDASSRTLVLSTGGIEDASQVGKVTVGFVRAASGRTALNPAVRSFLISNVLQKTEGDTITLSENFTNYGSLREGQLVFGDGVRPHTVITRVLPALRQVEVSPGGLPEEIRLDVQNGVVSASQSPSLYYGEGFDEYLQMPAAFNDFFRLAIGQRVTGVGLSDTAVITAIDPVYRQIGLAEGSVTTAGIIADVTFKGLERVDFGMISDLGTGTAAFAVTPFGYGGTAVTNPRLGSGLATVAETTLGSPANQLRIVEFTDESVIQKSNPITGVGLHNGYRIWSFDGRNVSLFSTEIGEDSSGLSIKVDSGFTAFGELRLGMTVTGPGVPAGTVIADFSEQMRTVTLNQSAGAADYLVFGSPFTPAFLANKDAQSAITVHRQSASISSSIRSENSQAEIRYQVTTNGGTTNNAGSLATMLLLAQRNEVSTSANGTAGLPVVTFADGISEIRLGQPLPTINTRPIVLDATTTLDGAPRTGTVAIDGRFISTTQAGGPVRSTSVVNGLEFAGSDVSGSVVRGIRLGGFINGAAVRIDGAAGVLVDEVQIGLTTAGGRAGADYGVLVTGDTAHGNTILNSSVVGAGRAGIRVESGATSTRVVGTTVGSEAIGNAVGIEVVASGTLLGAASVDWQVASGTAGSLTPLKLQAELRAGQREVRLTATADQWGRLTPGLAVIGNGLANGSRIISVDHANGVVVLNQAVTRNVSLADSNLLIGYAGTSSFGSNALVLDDSVPLEQVFLGQEVRIVSGESATDVTVTRITALDRSSRTVTLANEFAGGGLYGRGVRLVEFVRPAENLIQYNGRGVVVGLFSTASGSAGSAVITLPSGFSGWQSLAGGMAVFGAGVAAGTTVSGWDEVGRTVTLSRPLAAGFTAQSIRFAAADALQMVNTSVVNNVGDGLVVGGGEYHQIGRSITLQTYETKEAVSLAKAVDEAIFELVSWETTSDVSVTGVMRINDARLGESLEALNDTERGQLSVYGTGLPEGTTIASYADGVVTLSAGPGVAFTQTENATIYFGLGRYVAASPSIALVGLAVEGAGITEFTEVTAVRAPSAISGQQKAGYLAVSLPQTGLPNPFGLNIDWPEIRLVNRGPASNVFALNGGYGITVQDISIGTQLYGNALPTWLFAGNYLDIAFNRTSGAQPFRPNAAGSLSPALFAEIFGNDGNDSPRTFSDFDKSDDFGNQYAIQLNDFGQPEVDNPFEPNQPPGGGEDPPPDEEGDPPAPEDDLWPGVFF